MSYVHTYLFPAKKRCHSTPTFLREANRCSLSMSIKALHLQKIIPLNCTPHLTETIDPHSTNYCTICQRHAKGGGLLDNGVMYAEF